MRDVVVSLRLTVAEAAHIDAAAKALVHPRTRADYCRAAALHAARARVPAPKAPIRRPARRTPSHDTRLLAQILGQLGQLADAVRRTGRTGMADTVTAEITQIRQAVTTALGAA